MGMVETQVVIPTVKSRIMQANGLALKTGGLIVVDPVGDGSEESATRNHARALQSAHDRADWVVVLEDDAEPIENFTEILTRQLSEISPDKIVSLYLGKQRPPSIQGTIESTLSRNTPDTSWLTTRMLWWGVGVCVPRKYVTEVRDYTLSHNHPWDTSIGLWALTNQVEVWYSWPSLVDHSDGDTTIRHADGQSRASGRKAWGVGEPVSNGTTNVIK